MGTVLGTVASLWQRSGLRYRGLSKGEGKDNGSFIGGCEFLVAKI